MSDANEGPGKRKTSVPERFAPAGKKGSAGKQRKMSPPKGATADGPVGASGVGGVGQAADAPPDSASLFKKRTEAFVRHMLDDPSESILRRIVVPGHEQHEKFACGMLHVIDHKVFLKHLMKMINEDTEGIWPVESERPTWAVYSMLRQNGFKEIYFGSLMFGEPVKDRGAPPGEMMWYRRYKYTHKARLDAERATPFSESEVLALATSG